jgi:hypothetical protein
MSSIRNAAAHPYRVDSTDPISVIQRTNAVDAMNTILDAVTSRWFASVAEYLKRVQRIASTRNLHKGGSFYRGVNDATWSLGPGSTRGGVEDREVSLLEDFLVSCGPRGGARLAVLYCNPFG